MHLSLPEEIAAAAARLVVEEGQDYGQAKRRALRILGLPPRTVLPDNEQVEDAVREHIALFHADTQPAELHALREIALRWMERMADFRPHLAGAVWHGTATRHSEVFVQLFCDDSKSAEIALIDRGVDYDPQTITGFQGEPVEALGIVERSRTLGQAVGVHLVVYDYDDLRGALRPDRRGRLPRGDLAAVRALLRESPPPSDPPSTEPPP
jgi:hypothetical protein